MSHREVLFILGDSVYKTEIFIPWIEVVQPDLVHSELDVRLALGLLVYNKNHLVASVCDKALKS